MQSLNIEVKGNPVGVDLKDNILSLFFSQEVAQEIPDDTALGNLVLALTTETGMNKLASKFNKPGLNEVIVYSRPTGDSKPRINRHHLAQSGVLETRVALYVRPKMHDTETRTYPLRPQMQFDPWAANSLSVDEGE